MGFAPKELVFGHFGFKIIIAFIDIYNIILAN